MLDITKFVSKGWGYELWITNNEKYCLKLLHLVRNRRCSVHFHKIKDETFFISSGKVSLSYVFPSCWEYYESVDLSHYKPDWKVKSKEIILESGDVFHVPPMTIHEFCGISTSEIFEVSTQHFDEDSYRIVKGH